MLNTLDGKQINKKKKEKDEEFPTKKQSTLLACKLPKHFEFANTNRKDNHS